MYQILTRMHGEFYYYDYFLFQGDLKGNRQNSHVPDNLCSSQKCDFLNYRRQSLIIYFLYKSRVEVHVCCWSVRFNYFTFFSMWCFWCSEQLLSVSPGHVYCLVIKCIQGLYRTWRLVLRKLVSNTSKTFLIDLYFYILVVKILNLFSSVLKVI